MSKIGLFELYDKLREGKGENFGTGIVGEEMIIKGYKLMTIKDLESLRFIINKIINQKRKQHDNAAANSSGVDANKQIK
jgi:hypothetical protein